MKPDNQNDQYKENENDGITILNFINGYELGIYDSISTKEECKMFFPSFCWRKTTNQNFKYNLKRVYNFLKKLIERDRRVENLIFKIDDFEEWEWDYVDGIDVELYISLYDIFKNKIIRILFLEDGLFSTDNSMCIYYDWYGPTNLGEYNLYYPFRFYDDRENGDQWGMKWDEGYVINELCEIFKESIFDKGFGNLNENKN
jgi:hypothetical protein